MTAPLAGTATKGSSLFNTCMCTTKPLALVSVVTGKQHSQACIKKKKKKCSLGGVNTSRAVKVRSIPNQMEEKPIPGPDARTLRAARRTSGIGAPPAVTGGPAQAPILAMPHPGMLGEQPHQYVAAAAALAAAAAAQLAAQNIGYMG